MKIGKILIFAIILSIVLAGAAYKIMDVIKINKTFKLAELNFEEGKFKEAISLYDDVLKLSDTSTKSLISQYKLYKAKVKIDAENSDLHLYFILKNKALYLKENLKDFYTESLYILGKKARNEKEFEKAIEYFKQILQDTPTSTYADNAVFEIAMIFKAQNKLVQAQKTLKTIIKNYPDTDLLQEIQDVTGNINMTLLFQLNSPFTTTHTVKPGDSIANIAKKYHTTITYIKKANNLSRSIIRPTDELIVPNVVLSMVIDKSKNTLTLKGNESTLKVYRVGTGQYNKTPIGTFKIINKLVDPPWYSKEGLIPPGDKRNLLGTRWLGLNVPSYGIHGTTQPETIGSQSSAGCVRMLNEEVEQLYDIIPKDTAVTIID